MPLEYDLRASRQLSVSRLPGMEVGNAYKHRSAASGLRTIHPIMRVYHTTSISHTPQALLNTAGPQWSESQLRSLGDPHSVADTAPPPVSQSPRTVKVGKPQSNESCILVDFQTISPLGSLAALSQHALFPFLIFPTSLGSVSSLIFLICTVTCRGPSSPAFWLRTLT